MRIAAKYNGRCAECNGPTKKGKEIDYRDKKARHIACVQEPESRLDAEQFGLAATLGFIEYRPDMSA